MSIRFILGGAGSGKSYTVRKEIIEKAKEQPEKQFFLIVPDQFTMNAQKEMVKAMPGNTIMNIDVQSFSRLSYRIFEEIGQKELLTIDDTGKNLILKKVSSELAREEKLPVLGKNLEKIGCLHEAKSVISEFMQYGLSVEDVEKLIAFSETRSALNGKLKDIKVLYEAFRVALAERYITGEEKLELLAKGILRSDLLKGAEIYFDGFTGFTPVQRGVIASLLQVASEVTFTFTMDETSAKAYLAGKGEDHENLFTLTKSSISILLNLAAKEKITRGEDLVLADGGQCRHGEDSDLFIMEKNVFRRVMETSDREVEDITISALASPREELKEVCREILRLIREKKYAYRDFAVVTGELSRYASSAKELFEQYGLPVFLDQSVSVTKNPFMEYILSGLDVLVANYSYDSVMRFLRSGLTAFSSKEIDDLAIYLKTRGIKGKNAWQNMFVKGFYGDNEKMQYINRLRERVCKTFEPFENISGRSLASVKELTEKLYAFICQNEIEAKLKEKEKYFESLSMEARAKEYSQIYRYMMDVLSKCHELLGNERMSLKEYKEMLSAGASEMSIGMIPKTVDHITFGDLERTRLSGVKVLFMVGVNDGVIPKSASSAGMISELDRAFLKEGGFELSPSPREKAVEQRLYLYSCMCLPSEKLYLSYAVMDEEGKELRPSYLMDVLKRVFKKLEVKKPAFMADETKLVSEVDLKSLFAENIREFAAGNLEAEIHEQKKSFLAKVYQFGKEESWAKDALEAAYYSYDAKPLAESLAKALYGEKLNISISRLERFATCAYEHFLQYGMKLSDENTYDFKRVDLGNFFHDILQKFGMKLSEDQISWGDITEEIATPIVKDLVKKEATSYEEAVLYKDATTAYAIKRLERILLRTVLEVGYQIAKGGTVRMQFERENLRKMPVEGLSDIDVSMKVKIDRVDTFETEDTIYVRIVDYKSSKSKTIDVKQVQDGIQLQLPIYLSETMEALKEQDLSKEVKAAGMFYYHVQDPFFQPEKGTNKNHSQEEATHKELRLTGLFPEDPTVYKLLDRNMNADTCEKAGKSSDVVKLTLNKGGSVRADQSDAIGSDEFEGLLKTAKEKAKEHTLRMMKEGDKTASPYEPRSCELCSFREICHFDTRIKGFQYQTKNTEDEE